MKKAVLTVCGICLLMTFLSADIIEKIVIEGNRKVSRDTILFYLKSKPNDIYSEEILRKDFKALWETGFFENIKIETLPGDRGVIVKINLKENLFIKEVNYKTSKGIKKEDIIEKLQDNNIILSPFSYFDAAKLKRAERVIMDMLAEKGFNESKVNIATRIEAEQVSIDVEIVQGPKTRIGTIVFPGLDTDLISPQFLSRGLENNKPHNLINVLGGKDIYHKETIKEDLEAVKLRLQEKGYLEAKVGNPSLSFFPKVSAFGKVQKMMRLEIPIEMGPRYRIRNIAIEGNKVVVAETLRRMIRLREGDIYDMKKRNEGLEDIQKLYGALGYCRSQIVPVDNLDPVNQTADLTIRISEDDVCYLGKLEFVGNTFTKDHVIRREWLLKEGRRLNMNALEDSIRRMKQLGLVTIEKMPEIVADRDDPYKINIKAEVKELQRQMINFNVGYSGYEGWFIALGYSTQNFLGLGERFTVNLSSGTRAKSYRLAFTEPYLFNLPASLGFDLFKISYQYPGLFTRESQGVHLTTSFRFWKYFGASFMVGSEKIEITDVNEDLEYINPYSYYYYQEGKRTLNSFSPTLYYSTVDSPLFPSSGTKYLINYRYSGGLLGGDIYLHKLRLEFVKFIPLMRNKNTFGMHAMFQYAFPFGEDENGDPNTLQYYEKYYLGGERSIRGFDVYQVGPRNPDGFGVGGDKALYLNFEYHFPLSQQLSFVAFYDVGNAWDEGVAIDLKDVYTSLGVELKIYIPMMGVPFRLIFAYNPRLLQPDDSHFAFRFGIGPSFY